MGKTQSKRSVDITTESKKGSDEEVTGKLEKIADIDQKQVNGDATPQENDAEKRDSCGIENDKDLTTEKSAETAAQTSGENGDPDTIAASTTTEAEIPKDSTTAVTTTTNKEGGADAAATEEISPLADENSKKSKKEKVKKKWSFRSISFGKKDKQKPAKTEEVNESTAATNGTEKSGVEDGATETAAKNSEADENAEAAATTTTKPVENGDASEIELNGKLTPTSSNEEKSTEAVVNDNNSTAAIEETPAIVPSINNESVIENQTENKAAVVAAIISTETTVETTAAILSNGEDVEKNGITDIQKISTDQVVCEMPSDAAATVIPTTAISDGYNAEEEKPHQNGTNVDVEQEADDQQIKSQIEVKTNTDNSSAEHFVSSNCTSSDPPIEIRESNKNLGICKKEDNQEMENVNIVVITENKATPDTSEFLEECMVRTKSNTQPPPLPSLPPPSQVSIFALNNENTETSTEISTKSDEVVPTFTTSLRDESKQSDIVSEEIKNTKEVASSPISTNETNLSIPLESQVNVKHADADNSSNESKCINDTTIVTKPEPELVIFKEETFVLVTREEPSNGEQEICVEITEELTVAKEVVSEITAKAVNLVQQALQQQIEEQNQSEEEQVADFNIGDINTEYKMDKEQNEHENNITEMVSAPVAIIQSEIEISAPHDKLEPILVSDDDPQSENQDEVCSLTEKQIEIDSLIKDGIEAFSSDLVSSTKEIATAKDLKENAAAEITQQDLPVTCE